LWWLSHIAGSESVTGINTDAKPWKVLGLLDASRLCPWGVEPLVAIYQQAASTGPKQLVIAFRGTDPLNLMDWVTKSRFELTDWIGGRDAQVHRSFQESLQAKFKTTKKDLTTGKVAVGSTIESVLLNLVRTHDARVWLTGHSLGGALAQLMAASLEPRVNNLSNGSGDQCMRSKIHSRGWSV
jgi:hypothetical protein